MNQSNKFERIVKNKQTILGISGILIAVLTLLGVALIAIQRFTAPSTTVSARVSEVKTLNDKLLPVVSDYNEQQSVDEKAELLAEAERLAKEREAKVLDLIKNDPAAANQILLPSSITSQFPPSVSKYIEAALTLPGELITVAAESRPGGDKRIGSVVKYDYYIETDKGRVSLYLPEKGAELVAKSNQKVKVTGVKLYEHMALSGTTSVQTTSAVSTQNVAGPKKVATLLFNFANSSGSGAQPISADQARAVIYTGQESVNDYYQTSTFGKMSITGKLNPSGDVYGWITIDQTNSTCSYDQWRVSAQTAAQNQGIDLTGYDNIVMIFPYSSACAWDGLAEVSGKNVWINGGGNATLHPITHELGHNYGLLHASGLECTLDGQRVSISGTCTSREYEDFYDPMGNLDIYHFNIFNKGRLGLLTESNTQTVTTSGTYSIVPLERTSTGVMALRIPRDDKSFYYLENRASTDKYDTFSSTAPEVKGVSIRLATDYSQLSKTHSIDTTPSSAGFWNRALPLGESFYDPIKGITVKALSASTTGVTVEVTLGSPQADTTPPTQPTKLSGSTGIDSSKNTYVQLIWNASTDNYGIAGYDIYRDGVLHSTSRGWLWIETGQPYSTTHSYYVVARDAAGNRSQPSSTVSVTTPDVDTQPPSVPTQLSAQSPTPTQVNLTWQASTDNLEVQGYYVYRDGIKIAASGTSFGDATVSPDTTYTYTVAAYDFSGNLSAQSAPVSIKTGSSSSGGGTTPPPSSSTGGITGRIVDARTNTPVSGARITVVRGPSTMQSTTSDAFGGYALNLLPIGNYQLEISSSQYRNAKKINAKVTSGNIIIIDVEMR